MRVVAVVGNPNRGGRTTAVAEKVAMPVMLGGLPDHALAVETQLRPILVEFAAITPTKDQYVVDSELDQFDTQLDTWWTLGERPLQALLRPPVA
jgi:FMN reductase